MPLRSVLLASAASLVASQSSAFTLNVLHINDFHSRIESINAFDSTCSAEEEAADECFGGAARLKTAIDEARDALTAAGENVLVLDGGDEFQGSLFFNTYSGEAELEMMNRIGYDAMAVGNHEFDLGPEPLEKFIAGAEFDVLSGNTVIAQQGLLAGLKEDVVLDFGGEKVAVIGMTTPDTVDIASPGPDVSFTDPVEYLTGKVAELEAAGVTKIVVLGHLGTPEDIRVAEAVPGIDLIVGGHTHTLFSNTLEGAAHPYPLLVEGPTGVPVPIVQAGAYSKYLGQIAVTFDDAGVVTEAVGDTRILDSTVIPDPEVLARIGELAAPLEELKSQKVAEIAAPIDGSRESCRAVECEMGNLIAEAMLDRVRDQGVTIAIQNGGGIRASIGAGVVTKGDVLTVLPFQNTLSTFNLSGAGVLAALENGLSQVEEGAGRFPQVAGLTYSWDPAAPPLGRVREVQVRAGDGWAPLDPAATYTLVTNNYVRTGGDGFAVLRDEATDAYDFGPGLEDVVADYLAARPDYQPFTDGRIVRVE